MSLKSDHARIEFLLTIIDDIELIIKRHGTAVSALEDREGHHALLMCLFQIGETMWKLEQDEFISQLPINLSKGLRNIIAHDYLGVSNKRIADTLNTSIPELKNVLQGFINHSN